MLMCKFSVVILRCSLMIQVAVALMRAFNAQGDSDDVAAEKFAKALHKNWGVGRQACQNGVLLLLSLDNRQIFISTGDGTMEKLTFDQLGLIMDEAKPFLRNGK